MAEDSDLEKTESATPRRLEKAREEGQIVRSRELSRLPCCRRVSMASGRMSGTDRRPSRVNAARALTFDHAQRLRAAPHVDRRGRGEPRRTPCAAADPRAAPAAPRCSRRWRWAAGMSPRRRCQPKFSRLDPIAGLGRIFSINGPLQLGMSLAKTLVVGIIGGVAIWHRREDILALATQPLHRCARQHRAPDRRVLRDDGRGHVPAWRRSMCRIRSGSTTRSSA